MRRRNQPIQEKPQKLDTTENEILNTNSKIKREEKQLLVSPCLREEEKEQWNPSIEH
jgi:hypothetical protein